jgi:hypothetical protein
MTTIKIINSAEEPEDNSKGLFGNSSSTKINEVDSDELKSNLNELIANLSGVLDNVKSTDGYKLKQFTVGVEISAKGGVSLIGKLEAGAKAAVSLVFEKD